MNKNRLEAFSDGVIAIIITIMVLNLRVPHSEHLAALKPLIPTLLAYILSFVYVAIYWNNHHHMLQTCGHVTGAILWANLHLLFWLSLFPFATGWMGINLAAPVPTGAYGVVLLMAAIAYWILQLTIIRSQQPGSILEKAVGSDWKGKASPIAYLLAIPLNFYQPHVAQLIFVLIAMVWLIPDRRIERALAQRGD